MKRATKHILTNFAPPSISIHALMKRATEYVLRLKHSLIISIHALMKRATLHCRLTWPQSDNFNPRPHEEGDLCQQLTELQVTIFQSTPSWRGRLLPRLYHLQITAISIHALMKRATDRCGNITQLLVKFQSTPSWRGRLALMQRAIL